MSQFIPLCKYDESHPGWHLLLKERIGSQRSDFFHLRVDPLQEGKQNMKIVEFSYPGSVLAHLKRNTLLLEGSKLVLYM